MGSFYQILLSGSNSGYRTFLIFVLWRAEDFGFLEYILLGGGLVGLWSTSVSSPVDHTHQCSKVAGWAAHQQ